MKEKIQLVLAIGITAAAIRVGWIFYERHQSASVPAKQQGPMLEPDFYVTSKKIFPYDVKSAKQLTQQPAWAKVGYAYAYYPYDRATHRADLVHEAGKLGPIQKLDIKDVVTGVAPKSPGERQILAVFDDAGKSYATPVGAEKSGDYKFWINDMLYLQDPRELYKHWPADIWQAIDQHQVKPGMNELQADFAIGIGLLESGSDSTDRTLNYPNGGKPVTVSFHNGKAVEVRPGAGG